MEQVALKPRVKIVWRLVLVAFLAALCAGCRGNVEPELSYKPAYLPVEFTFGSSGFSVRGENSIVTPIGQFSIGARYSLPPHSSNSIYVILRNRRTGYDRIFEVRSGSDQFDAVVNGTTNISIANDQVLIDVTSGKIKKIRFKRVNNQISEQGHANWLQNEWRKATVRWGEGYNQSWYRPYGLTRWAYDDSTIEKWYGIGFVWFLLRLILSLVMAIVDTVLTAGFLVGQAAFIIFGPTGRDVIYGLLVLGMLALAGTAMANA